MSCSTSLSRSETMSTRSGMGMLPHQTTSISTRLAASRRLPCAIRHKHGCQTCIITEDAGRSPQKWSCFEAPALGRVGLVRGAAAIVVCAGAVAAGPAMGFRPGYGSRLLRPFGGGLHCVAETGGAAGVGAGAYDN